MFLGQVTINVKYNPTVVKILVSHFTYVHALDHL